VENSLWIFYAALVAVFVAARRVTNQHFRWPALDLVFATKLFLCVFTLPFLFFITWPTSPWFYFFTILTGPFAYYKDMVLYDFTAKFGAGVVTRIEPLSVPLVFIAWLLLDFSLFQKQIEMPLVFAGIVLCIGAATFFTSRLRHCSVNKKVLRAMVPLVICSGMLNLIGKGSTEYMPDDSSVLVYIFVQSVIIVAISVWRLGMASAKQVLVFKDNKLLTGVLFLGLSLFVVIGLRMLAIKGAANPAYATSVMLTGPFWVLLFNRLLKHKEEGNIVNGIGIVVSVILLAFLATFYRH